MYAIVETGGKQFRVAEKAIIDVEKVEAPVGETVTLDRVLMVNREGEVSVGNPVLENAKVVCKVLAQDKTRKVVVFRYKAKKNERKRYGHRQAYSRLLVERIEA